MKHLILILALTSSSFAVAAHAEAAQTELCAYDANADVQTGANLQEIEKIDVKTVAALPAFELGLVNAHLMDQEYTDHALTLAEIQHLFNTEDGEQAYNDLYLITLKAGGSGHLYTEVKSYPGDNPYSMIFNAITGTLVGKTQDGDMILVDGSQQVYCSVALSL